MSRGTLLAIPVPEERFGSSFLISLSIHVFVAVLFFVLPYLLPRTTPITLGTGAGGGMGGGSYTVGIADDLGGGEGMFKPSLTPQPPVLAVIPAPKEDTNAVPLPSTVEPKKPAPKTKEEIKASAKQPAPKEMNVIPVPPGPGAGSTGGVSGGSGGGRGGGVGVEIGGGSGGFADSWYARAVESRIGANWIRPAFLERVEIVYSFVITNEGNIREIKKEKSSGNDSLDLTAERAIRASTPLPPLPPELRGRPVQFMAQFIHPPNP